MVIGISNTPQTEAASRGSWPPRRPTSRWPPTPGARASSRSPPGCAGRSPWVSPAPPVSLRPASKGYGARIPRACIPVGLVETPPDEAEHPGEVWACVPDHVEINPKYLLDATVRRHRPSRPPPSDPSPDISLLIPEEISKAINETESHWEGTEQLARSHKVQLQAWLATSAAGRRTTCTTSTPWGR